MGIWLARLTVNQVSPEHAGSSPVGGTNEETLGRDLPRVFSSAKIVHMRQLATYETISEIRDIPNADAIEVARVRGWDVVVSKGEFNVGDEVVYFELDSALPLDDERFSFLGPRGTRPIDGKNYHVLSTVRLRGQFSQGLVLPAELFPELPDIFKYEKPIPPSMAGRAEGAYPIELAPKTDAERIQNLGKYIDKINELDWTATEKIDGTSTSFINDPQGKIRVAGRNWELSIDHDERAQFATDNDIWSHIPTSCTLQGEYFGEGIQNNSLAIKGRDFRAFSLWYSGDGIPKVVPFHKWPEGLKKWQVPVLDLKLPSTVDEIVEQANKLKSQINPQKNAEGIVWHTPEPHQFLGGRTGFKSINNQWLLKNS